MEHSIENGAAPLRIIVALRKVCVVILSFTAKNKLAMSQQISIDINIAINIKNFLNKKAEKAKWSLFTHYP